MNRKILYFIIVAITTLLSFGSCTSEPENEPDYNPGSNPGNNPSVNPPTTTSYDVYVVGYETGNDSVAKYWKNGVGFELPQGTYAHSIAIVNGDIYIAGGYKNSAKYWKNGQPVNLADGGAYLAEAHDIKIYNGDVYVSGMIEDKRHNTTSAAGMTRRPVYWKNGQVVDVGSYTSQGILRGEEKATHICFDDGSIYLYLSNINSRAVVYWRDGQRIACNTAPSRDIGVCMDVKNGDVHIAGISITANVGQCVAYWKNTYYTAITDYTHYTSSFGNTYNVTDIEAYNNDVYIAGSDDAGNATYWKNGKAVVLEGGSIAGAIKIADGNVFAAGGGRKTLNYWQNGKVSKFNATGDVTVTAMAVVKK